MHEERPNFLIFCTDQMRADHMGCAGNPAIRTPNLDALASEGVLLSRAYVNCPLCMPCRATLFTGLTPRGHRVRTNGIPLDRSIPTLPGALAGAGYRTASVGKVHLSNFDLHPQIVEGGVDPRAFPECRAFWEDGRVSGVPVPYYGLEHVEIALGHANVLGDYALWLQREHPAQWAKLRSEPFEKSPLRAEGCATPPLEDRFHHTAWVADRTITYLQGADRARPFYLMCSFPDPHHPYHPPRPWDRMYAPEDVIPPVGREGELEDLAPFFRRIYEGPLSLSGRRAPTQMPEAHRREILAYTYGMVSLVDHHVGRVLGALEGLGLRENTVVVFLSDHGDMMGDHGLLNKGPFHFEGLLRVPMIWRFPGRFAPRATPALASLLDFVPTVLDLAGVPAPEGPASPEAAQQPPALPGRSLEPLLEGRAGSVQASVVVENDEDYLGLRLRTLVTPTHKLTTYTGHRGPERFGELFDLEADPDEVQNLWDRDGAAGVKQELLEQLHYRLTETDIAVPRRLSHA